MKRVKYEQSIKDYILVALIREFFAQLFQASVAYID